MNIRDLEYLVSLAEFKHFRRAADACNVSQPTLSGQIRKLEDELGITLLERTSRKVLFTQSGLLLVEQAKQVLREVKLLKEMASNQGKDMTGPLHIGVIPTVGPYLLPYIMPVLKEEFPELELFLYEAQTNQLVDQLETGRLDCAILAAVAETEPFIQVPLFNEKMLVAVSETHSWAKEKNIPLDHLKGMEVLMLDDGHCLRDQALGYCFAAGARENAHFQATSLEMLRNMIAANAGITLMPELAVLNEGQRQGVKYIPCVDPEPQRTITLIYRPGSPLRARYERVASAVKKAVKPILEGD
ncbi:DNA-binding transcriptional regulator OxyR [Exercitatus varius]|uniref:DNA-binding transcriptional regulator OxyR n=1 Tax=Exercitatus varius TaxID=67857 RepID=A0ABT6EUT1_9PAST|nr:DNA-binding transcriptional regulator OxyR [Exercitatus varius]QOF67576.1 DNA-binding transcriptional regulator OxyR [Actinobacillus sp. GY-402]MDG2939804.1 DNA-binding transcriptional regulator OxyR [Exercitatus varius]MDG2944598.1 DNA-binding transcriptional regulator OxyR [Exercitatus varius]MDG2946488.1 DNA-binding transcriptional regulator OxyR [Exercitatus varius]MDG2948304.1 DNA-binding transcriptional regulator OxyR [Exercitatus varius]